MKQFSILFLLIILFTACGAKKSNSSSLHEIDSIEDSYVDTSVKFSVQDVEPDTANFTAKDWKDFEDALTDEFGESIYPTFLAYEKALDSCGLLDTAIGEGYLRLLDKLSNKNDLTLLSSCNNLLDDKTQDKLMLLISAFTNTINTSPRTQIKFTLQFQFNHLTQNKKAIAPNIVETIISALGRHDFDKKICQATALLFIMNMVM
jgi:hypothetical protein